MRCDLADGTFFDFTSDGQWHISNAAGAVVYGGKPLIRYIDIESEFETTTAEPREFTKSTNGAAVQFDFIDQFRVDVQVSCLDNGAQVEYTVQSMDGRNLLYLDPFFGTAIKDPTLPRKWIVPANKVFNYRYPRVSYGGDWYEAFAPAITTAPERGVSLITGYDLPEGDIIFGQGRVRSFSLPLAKFRPANHQFIYSCETCSDAQERCDYTMERKRYFDHGNYLPSASFKGTYYFGTSATPNFDGYFRWFADILWKGGKNEVKALLDSDVDPNRVFMSPPHLGWTAISEEKTMPPPMNLQIITSNRLSLVSLQK